MHGAERTRIRRFGEAVLTSHATGGHLLRRLRRMRVHSLAAADAVTPARRLLWLPPPAVLSSLVLLVLGILLTLSKGLADPDYFWHIATGNLILDSGRIPSVDPFSLTWQGRPWVLHEWLSEALMTALVRAIGALPTLGLFGTLLPLGFGVLGFTFLAQRLPLRAVMLSVLFAAAVAFPYATIRPQVISWFLLSVLLALLLLARPGRSWLIVACIPLFTVWANLHGLWVVGLATFGWYVLATLFRATPMRERRVTVVLVGVACVAATLLTPSGLDGLLYPLRYIDAGDWGLAHIPEWASPNFHDLVQAPLLLWIALAPILGRSSPGWPASCRSSASCSPCLPIGMRLSRPFSGCQPSPSASHRACAQRS